MNQKVLVKTEDSVAIIVISHPSVNSLGLQVRKGLLDALETADNNSGVLAIVIKGAGKTFPVGADIKEFATEDPVFWTPSALILRLVKSKKNIGNLNE